jgi:hypothetical protein
VIRRRLGTELVLSVFFLGRAYPYGVALMHRLRKCLGWGRVRDMVMFGDVLIVLFLLYSCVLSQVVVLCLWRDLVCLVPLFICLVISMVCWAFVFPFCLVIN